MAVVPIEVVIEDVDVSAPSVPEEIEKDDSVVVVPNTGNVTNGDISSLANWGIMFGSAVFIMVGLLAFLLLRKKHRVNREEIRNGDMFTIAGIGKHNKLSTFVCNIARFVTVIAFVVVVSQFVFSSIVQPAFFAAAVDDGILSIETSEKIVFNIKRSLDGAAVSERKEDVSKIISEAPYGYEVLLSAKNTDKLCRVSEDDDEDEYCISPVDGTVLGDNTWGYSLDVSESSDYSAVTIVPTIIDESYAPRVAVKDLYVYYAVKVSNDLPVGVYRGEIEYTIEPKELTYMQQMTPDICNSLEEEITLTDKRDNKNYTVAKLADDKCWMTQNLDFNIEAGREYTYEDTDLELGRSWIPRKSTKTTGAWEELDHDLESYDPGDLYWSGEPCGMVEGEWTCPDLLSSGDSHRHLGNYYNWNAAVAGDDVPDGLASRSICPAGWTLPQPEVDFVELILAYDYNGENRPSSGWYGEQNLVLQDPSYFNLGGYYCGEEVCYAGTFGLYWTNTARSGVSSNGVSYEAAYYAEFFYRNEVYPRNYGVKNQGISIRCVARQE